MLCLLSLFLGVQNVILCFEQKTLRTLCTWRSVSQAPGGRDCRVLLLLLFGGSWNELLSTRNPSVPGFHPIRSHEGHYWEPLNEFYRSPFRMKNKCFSFFFLFFLFFSFLFVVVIESMFLYLKGWQCFSPDAWSRHANRPSCVDGALETITFGEVCLSLYPHPSAPPLPSPHPKINTPHYVLYQTVLVNHQKDFKINQSNIEVATINTPEYAVTIKSPLKDVKSTIILSLLIYCMKIKWEKFFFFSLLVHLHGHKFSCIF